MSKLRKWFYRHFDFARSCMFWLLAGSLLFSAGTAGYFIAMARASGWMAQQREDAIQQVASLQEANEQLIQIIKTRLPEITSNVDDAAKMAKEAADTAKDAAQAASGAGATARSASANASRAASAAKTAATKASEAAADVKEAVTTTPDGSKDAPKWLDGP